MSFGQFKVGKLLIYHKLRKPLMLFFHLKEKEVQAQTVKNDGISRHNLYENSLEHSIIQTHELINHSDKEMTKKTTRFGSEINAVP